MSDLSSPVIDPDPLYQCWAWLIVDDPGEGVLGAKVPGHNAVVPLQSCDYKTALALAPWAALCDRPVRLVHLREVRPKS